MSFLLRTLIYVVGAGALTLPASSGQRRPIRPVLHLRRRAGAEQTGKGASVSQPEKRLRGFAASRSEGLLYFLRGRR